MKRRSVGFEMSEEEKNRNQNSVPVSVEESISLAFSLVKQLYRGDIPCSYKFEVDGANYIVSLEKLGNAETSKAINWVPADTIEWIDAQGPFDAQVPCWVHAGPAGTPCTRCKGTGVEP
jgi:hypothetical protein